MMFEPNDFEDFYEDSHEEEWDEEKWEQYFQREDEQKRKLEELINKYGFSENGLRQAFEELGYDIPDEEASSLEDIDDLSLDENIEEMFEDEYDEWLEEDEDQQQSSNAHPLFNNCYNLILKIMKMLRHINLENRDHPLVTFQSGLFECLSKLIRAGYDDLEYKMDSERGLILAALKRSRKALYLSLLTIPRVNDMQILSSTTQSFFRHEITNLLKRINKEIITHKTQQ